MKRRPSSESDAGWLSRIRLRKERDPARRACDLDADFDKARSPEGSFGCLYQTLCPSCMTMLAYVDEVHICPHGRLCFVFACEDTYEWSCARCQGAFDERERLGRTSRALWPKTQRKDTEAHR